MLGLGRYCGGRHGNPFQYSCLENPHGQRSLVGYNLQDCTELDTTEATQHSCMRENVKAIKVLMVFHIYYLLKDNAFVFHKNSLFVNYLQQLTKSRKCQSFLSITVPQKKRQQREKENVRNISFYVKTCVSEKLSNTWVIKEPIPLKKRESFVCPLHIDSVLLMVRQGCVLHQT